MGLNLNQKISAIQTDESLYVAKDQNNGKQNYKYFNEDGLYSAIKPLLKKYGIRVKLTQTGAGEYFQDKGQWCFKAPGELQLIDIETGDIDSTDCEIDGGNFEYSKARTTAKTNTMKYELQKVFLLSSDDSLDVDSNKYQKQQENARKEQEKPKVVFTKDMEAVLKEIASDSQLGKDLKQKIVINLDGKPFRPENLKVIQNDTDLMNELMKMLESKEK